MSEHTCVPITDPHWGRLRSRGCSGRYFFGGFGRAGAPGRPVAVGRCGRADDGVGRFFGGVTRLLVTDGTGVSG